MAVTKASKKALLLKLRGGAKDLYSKSNGENSGSVFTPHSIDFKWYLG
jgi:hypothetical protein